MRLNSDRSVLLTALFRSYVACATWNCCRLGAHSVYTIQLCTTWQCHHHPPRSHKRRVHVCLAVACHLNFWQNDQYLLRATAVTSGWLGYRSKSRHRKLTLEKSVLPPILRGLELTNFRLRVRFPSGNSSMVNHSTQQVAYYCLQTAVSSENINNNIWYIHMTVN